MTSSDWMQLCIDLMTQSEDLVRFYPVVWAMIIARKIFYA
jgi:hypothetical protein